MKKSIPNTLIVETKEEIIQTDLRVQDILKTKQLIPHNFVKLEVKYFYSTLPDWPKSLCERYSFPQGEDWLFLDVPQELMKELELETGKEIPYPLYISSEVLKRKPVCGGITLRNKEEIFLLKPLASEKEVQTELGGDEIGNWEERLKEKDNQIIQLSQQNEELRKETKEVEEIKKELADLKKERDELKNKYSQLRTNVSNILYPEIEGATLAESDKELINHAKEVVKKLINVIDDKNVLEKEKKDQARYFINLIISSNWQYGIDEIELSNGLLVEELDLSSISEKLVKLNVQYCTNLKFLKPPIGTKKIQLGANYLKEEKFYFSCGIGTIDITQCLNLQSLSFGTFGLNGVYDKGIIKCKVIFHKSQRSKNFCWHNLGDCEYKGHKYDGNSPVSLDFLINKGLLTNYEERN